MSMHQTVELALKDKSPELYAGLKAKGELNAYVSDLKDQISSQVVSLTMAQRQRENWDRLGPMEVVRRMNMAQAAYREQVLNDMLEFPRDETSPPSQGETTPLDPTT